MWKDGKKKRGHSFDGRRGQGSVEPEWEQMEGDEEKNRKAYHSEDRQYSVRRRKTWQSQEGQYCASLERRDENGREERPSVST